MPSTLGIVSSNFTPLKNPIVSFDASNNLSYSGGSTLTNLFSGGTNATISTSTLSSLVGCDANTRALNLVNTNVSYNKTIITNTDLTSGLSAATGYSFTMWVKPSLDITTTPLLIENGSNGWKVDLISLQGSTFAFKAWNGSNTLGFGATVATSKWYHVGYTWNAQTSSVTGYIDGVPVGTITVNKRLPLSSLIYSFGSVGVSGWYGNYYISTFKLYDIDISSRITLDYNESASKYTCLNASSLLTLEATGTAGSNNGTSDISAYGRTLTQPGATIDDNPFNSSALGSCYFTGDDGNLVGNWIQTPFASELSLGGTGDFTFEVWIKPEYPATAIPANPGGLTICGIYDAASTSPQSWCTLINQNGNLEFVVDIGTVDVRVLTSTTNVVPSNPTWYHIAVTRSGTRTWRLFVNGTLEAQTNDSTNRTVSTGSASFMIGNTQNKNSAILKYKGFAANLRLVKGQAIYTSNFNPPTSYVTRTTNGGATDRSTGATIPGPTIEPSILIMNERSNIKDTTSANKVINIGTSRALVDVWSGYNRIYFDGNTGLLVPRSSKLLPQANQDFTIETWVYYSSTPTSQGYQIAGFENFSVVSDWYIMINNSNRVVLINGAALLTSPAAIGPNAWTHVAISRKGTGTNNLKMFVNGSVVAQTTNNNQMINTGTNVPLTIGCDNDCSNRKATNMWLYGLRMLAVGYDAIPGYGSTWPYISPP